MSQEQRPSRPKLWFRRLRSLLWTALSLVTLLAAVVVGVGKLVMPYSAHYQPQLEAWLSKEFNQPVKVDAFTGEWKAFGPRISLEGLNLLGAPGEAQAIAIRRAALDIKPLNALIAGRPLYSFRIIGADLELVLAADGHVELSGLGVTRRSDIAPAASGNSGLGNLARVGEVRLEQSRLHFTDQQRDIQLQLTNLNGRLEMKDDELAVAVHASIAGTGQALVLGDLGATVLVQLDEQRRLAAASWHMDAGELLLATLAEKLPEHQLKPVGGRLNAKLWGRWERGSAQRMDGVLDLRDLAFAAQPEPLQLDRLNSLFSWRFDDRRSWRIDLAEVKITEGGRNWSTPRLSVERHIAGGLGMWVSADYLDVTFPLALTQRILASVNGRWPTNMPTSGAGRVRDFDIVFNAGKKLAAVSGKAEQLEILDWGRWPQLAGISGEVDLLFGEGRAQLRGEAVRLDWPRNFRAPALLEVPACTLEVLWGERWQVDAQDCRVRHAALEVAGRARFVGNQGKPFVDLALSADRADLPGLADYWPESVIKPRVSDWLRRSLVAGSASDIRFSLYGDMDDFPFRAGEGSLRADFTVDDAVLDYHPSWPTARAVQAAGSFAGQGMQLRGSIGNLAGAEVSAVTARVEDFSAPLLAIDFATTDDLPRYVAFIEGSPLLANSQQDPADFEFAGPAAIQGTLSIPLGSSPGELGVSGVLRLDNNGFRERRSGFSLAALAGELKFDRDGFVAPQLTADYLGWPVNLELRSEFAATEPFSAQLEGSLPASLLIAESPLANDPLLAAVSGQGNWRASLSVQAPGAEQRAAGAVPETWLQIDSDLQGVGIALPAPLDKPAAAAWPLQLRYPIRAERTVFSARLAERLHLQLETDPLSRELMRGLVQLGAAGGVLPPPGFFSVGGHARRLDLNGWLDRLIDYFGAERPAGKLSLSEAELQIDELLMLNRSFAQVRMSLEERDEVLEAAFDSEALAGTVRYNRSDAGAHSLWMDMERLLLPEPGETGQPMETDPTRFPELHLYARQFRYLGLDMGATRIEAYPVADGLHIESVASESQHMTFQARGNWLKSGTGSRSDFDIVLTAESLGNLVNALNLSSVLEGGQTMVRYNAWWPGPPAAFSLAQLNGEMSFSVIDGSVLNADPGAGRMLGLFSVAALPRRLALDFRDVFSSGFSFDSASGTIKLVSGVAHTDDLVIESTAARLTISGSSDLVSQQLDYEMSVRPGVSQALPVIGALAAGPGGAAAGLALQGLLRQALGEAAEARYRIQGPWSEPEVIRLDNPPAGATTETGPAGPPVTKEAIP